LHDIFKNYAPIIISNEIIEAKKEEMTVQIGAHNVSQLLELILLDNW